MHWPESAYAVGKDGKKTGTFWTNGNLKSLTIRRAFSIRGVCGMATKSVSVLTLLPLAISSAFAQSAPLNCEGSLTEPTESKRSSMSATLTLGSPPSINIGNSALETSPISDNKIQLKFATKDFTGEYFHYTHQLFLIYKDRQLAHMTCSP
jgi:hypothetical protein